MFGNVMLATLLLALPVCLRFPFIGFLLYCWFDLAAPHVVFWNSLEFLPLAQLIGVATLAGVFVYWRGPRMINAFTVLLLMYVVWFTITYFQAFVPDAAHFKWDRSMKVFVPLAIMSMMLTTRARIELVMWMLVGVITASAIRGAALTLIWGGGGLVVIGPLGSFIEDRNVFATVMVMAIPLAIYLGAHSLHRPKAGIGRLIAIVVPLLILVAVVGTFSRGGLLALAAVGLTAVAFSRHKFVIAVTVVIAAVALIRFAPESWIERMGTTAEYKADASAMGRIKSWTFAVNLVREHPLGGGFAVFHLNHVEDAVGTEGYLDAHSWFFEILAEQGIPGIVLVLAIFLGALYRLYRVMRLSRASPELKWAGSLARTLFLAQCAMMSGGFFVGIGSYSFTYLVSMCAFSLYVIVRKPTAVAIGEPVESAEGDTAVPLASGGDAAPRRPRRDRRGRAVALEQAPGSRARA
ncbi:MAG: putative O-glycosylation ligase, exosortase A system-associated [Burkholderiaceae bacterium]|nr:putative O-glycosylation ligase, exosortase A system-associated [Burkholderiaceae bacterium]